MQVAALLDSIRKNMDTEFGRERHDRQRIVEADVVPLGWGAPQYSTPYTPYLVGIYWIYTRLLGIFPMKLRKSFASQECQQNTPALQSLWSCSLNLRISILGDMSNLNCHNLGHHDHIRTARHGVSFF